MPTWLGALLTRKMLICIFTGFSSGLPLYLLLNLLPAWLRSEGVDLKTIGFFALIQFPYTWKFLWSPLLDRFSPPGLGRRRGWMLLTQIGLLLSIGFLGGFDPKENIWPILWLATLLSLLSATQDIAVDAFRREILDDRELGLGNAVHVNAYRIAGLIPGSLSLILADRLPWSDVFWITGAFMLPGMLMAWLVSEPQIDGAPKTLRQAVTEPFHEFINRRGWRGAVLVLGFIFLYKLGDSLCTALATPFYLDMGFTKTDIGLIAKRHGNPQTGLRNLAALYLGWRIAKGARTTNWSAPHLTTAQIGYAATDAWVSRELYLCFERLGLTGGRTRRPHA